MPLPELIPQLEAELRQCESDAAALRQAISVLKRRSGGAPTARAAAVRSPGRTPGMILSTMRESEDEVWTAPAMTRALTEQGWATPQADATNAVRTAMARLAQRGDLLRMGSGEYRLPVEPQPQPSSLNGSSEPREEAMT
jgi:hypothetical protein